MRCCAVSVKGVDVTLLITHTGWEPTGNPSPLRPDSSLMETSVDTK